jgi:hypothetical protein
VTGSLYSPLWLSLHHPPVSIFQVLGFQACTTTSGKYRLSSIIHVTASVGGLFCVYGYCLYSKITWIHTLYGPAVALLDYLHICSGFLSKFFIMIHTEIGIVSDWPTLRQHSVSKFQNLASGPGQHTYMLSHSRLTWCSLFYANLKCWDTFRETAGLRGRFAGRAEKSAKCLVLGTLHITS